MHEYSSISVSSYDASSLAAKLTDQASDGWSVVAIVPTGSTVTAYLSREADADASTDEAGTPAAAFVETGVDHDVDQEAEGDGGDDERDAETALAAGVASSATMYGTAGVGDAADETGDHDDGAGDDSSSDEGGGDEGSSDEGLGEDSSDEGALGGDVDGDAHDESTFESFDAGDTTELTAHVDEQADHVADTPDPIDEPAGWAIAPEPASPSEPTGDVDPMATILADLERENDAETDADGAAEAGSESDVGAADSGAEATSEPSIEDLAASLGGDSGDSADVVSADAGDSGEVAADVAADGAGAAADAGAADAGAAATAEAAGAAPAGWYADPSARYELRYWDGTQWTEHVSRSGQQFTDPPVA